MIRVFWLFFTLCIITITHILYLLYVPAWRFEEITNSQNISAPFNRTTILDEVAARNYFPTFPSNSGFALCPYNISTTPVMLSIHMTDVKWLLAIYTISGQIVATIDDVQAGRDNLTVRLNKDGRDRPRENKAISTPNSNDWNINLSQTTGYALLWTPGRSDFLKGVSCKEQ